MRSASAGARLQQRRPEEQQVVVVDEVALLLALRCSRRRRWRCRPRSSTNCGYSSRRMRADGNLGVDVARVDVVQRLLLRESLLPVAEAELRARELHQVLGVALVHDGEVGREAGLRRRSGAAGGGRWRGRCRRARGGSALPTRRSARASISCAARRVKVSRRMRSGRTPRSSRMRDAVDEGARLARAGAGDDEERALAVRGGAPLGVVQPVGGAIACRRAARLRARARRTGGDRQTRPKYTPKQQAGEGVPANDPAVDRPGAARPLAHPCQPAADPQPFNGHADDRRRWTPRGSRCSIS